MKTYRIFDCTTILTTTDRFIFGFEWMARAYAFVLTAKTRRFHDYTDTANEATEFINV